MDHTYGKVSCTVYAEDPINRSETIASAAGTMITDNGNPGLSNQVSDFVPSLITREV